MVLTSCTIIAATKCALCVLLPATPYAATKRSHSVNKGASGSNTKSLLRELTSAVACSVVRPRPFSSMGRVITAQNSTKFCTVRYRTSFRARRVRSACSAEHNADDVAATDVIGCLCPEEQPSEPATAIHRVSRNRFIREQRRRARVAVNPGMQILVPLVGIGSSPR
jgi:hypothetical protein